MYEKYSDASPTPQSLADPPRGAHQVSAPFNWTTVNDPIAGDYIVSIATVSPSPDVRLHTVNGDLNIDLWFLGGLPRPIGIQIGSTNGRLAVSIPRQQHAQNLNLQLSNTNRDIVAGLPDTFHGILSISTVNGKLVLSEALLENSELLEHTERHAKYRIRPRSVLDASPNLNEKAVLEDLCTASNVSGSVVVGYHDEHLHLSSDQEVVVGRRSCCIVT